MSMIRRGDEIQPGIGMNETTMFMVILLTCWFIFLESVTCLINLLTWTKCWICLRHYCFWSVTRKTGHLTILRLIVSMRTSEAWFKASLRHESSVTKNWRETRYTCYSCCRIICYMCASMGISLGLYIVLIWFLWSSRLSYLRIHLMCVHPFSMY